MLLVHEQFTWFPRHHGRLSPGWWIVSPVWGRLLSLVVVIDGCLYVCAVVTITSGLISYPIDTIRRRMMMTSGEAVKYSGSLDCCVKVVRAEGFMSLMKGAGNAFAAILRVARLP